MITKWEKSDGVSLSKKEYNYLSSLASKNDIPLEDYLHMHGIRDNNSSGELQDPLNNSAEITNWVKLVDGHWLFLSKWKYKCYFEQSKEKGQSISEYLLSEGFVRWKSLFEEAITGWISVDSRIPLTRKEYIKCSNNLKDGLDIESYLISIGYVRLNVKKR